jgi:hypothetical protein
MGTVTPRSLCFHYAAAGTIDRTTERFAVSPFNDWMPASRANGSSW